MTSSSVRLLALAVALGLLGCADEAAPIVLETTLVSDTNDTAGPYQVATVVRDDTEVTGAWVFFSTDLRRNFEAVAMERVGPGAFAAPIRGFPLGTRVDYYVLARDGTANVGTDPAPVPDETHCFMVGTFPSRPEVLLVHPSWGPTTGGTQVTLIGSDFRPGVRVFFEGAEAERVTRVDAETLVAVTPAGAPGPADVRVQNLTRAELGDAACPGGPDEAGVAVLPDGFRYVQPPKPDLVVPDRGPTAGGTLVTVQGTGFVPGSAVTFDGAPATCTFVSAEALSCVTPPGDAGPADVQVTNPEGLTGVLPAGYVYVPPPEVFSVEPAFGPDLGGTEVLVRGRAFQEGALVFFDGLELRDVVFVDAGTLRGRTPPHPPGPVDVAVRNPDGQTGTLPRGFTYYGPPRIDAIVPAVGPTIGGQRVVIRGGSFAPGLTVTFDGLPAALVSVTDEEIVLTTPPHPEGRVTVIVTNPDGRSASTEYTYVPPPFLDGMAPTCGPTAGGTNVVVSGRNFQAGAVVRFGDAGAATTTVTSAVRIDAVTAPHPEGTVEVKVVNPDGGESPTPGSFTFVPAPRVDAVTPRTMLLCGGVPITIRGEAFLPGATVAVGNAPCADVQVVSRTEIRCVPPAATAGPARVTVTNHECLPQSSAGAVELVYEPLQIEPRGGLIAGFTGVRVSHSVSGTLPRRMTEVRFGGAAAELRTTADGRQLVQSPPHEVGEAEVLVTLEGCAPETAGQRFQYRVFVDRTAERLPPFTCAGNPTECHAADLRIADLNGDRLGDVIQANGGINTNDAQNNWVLLSQRARPGFLTPRAVPDVLPGGMNSARADAADIDGDGDLDVMFAAGQGGALYLNDGAGNLTRAAFSSRLESLPGAFDAQFADVNGDGRPDIVYLEIGFDGRNGQTPRNGPDHVFLNQGNGAFTEVANAFPTSIFSVHDHKMALADFDGDGRLDMVVTVDNVNYTPRPEARYLLGDGAGRFRLQPAPALTTINGDVFGVEAADFDGDGRPDLFLPNEGAARSGGICDGITILGRANSLLLNDGRGGFVDRSDLLPQHTEATIGSAKLDVDGDGDVDLVAVNHGVPTRIYVNDGSGRFHDATAALREPPLCALAAAAGDLDGSGVPALVIGGVFPTRVWFQTHTP